MQLCCSIFNQRTLYSPKNSNRKRSISGTYLTKPVQIVFSHIAKLKSPARINLIASSATITFVNNRYYSFMRVRESTLSPQIHIFYIIITFFKFNVNILCGIYTKRWHKNAKQLDRKNQAVYILFLPSTIFNAWLFV